MHLGTIKPQLESIFSTATHDRNDLMILELLTAILGGQAVDAFRHRGKGREGRERLTHYIAGETVHLTAAYREGSTINHPWCHGQLTITGQHAVLVPKQEGQSSVTLDRESVTVKTVRSTYTNEFTLIDPASAVLVFEVKGKTAELAIESPDVKLAAHLYGLTEEQIRRFR
jgi:hypothetical protein